MPVILIIIITALIAVSATYFFMTYKKHTLGEGATSQTIDIRILDKQTVTRSNAAAHEEQDEYWIYVEPMEGGPKREFQIGVHYYHAISPGDCGTLTYKGNQFMHFAKLQRF
ncbi:DUF2500 domain-containing protein [Veronia pacifica]|uniref:RNA polymerase subunit sigma n=1 Tax=Veronia pacifica TaxID=1080227 RepID=A0A1C3EJ52_9GAMM|nr:DUF2500 domain-containing protein [Veronia pacifica]ODA33249.1 RNA polymerase subunit sigma [Veronia pacifica]